jgi:hypothetical protein
VCEECCRNANVVDADKAAGRSLALRFFEEFIELRNSRGGTRSRRTNDPKQPQDTKGRAVAGILFSIVALLAFWLLRISIPAKSLPGTLWLTDHAKAITFALSLIPFAGIAFLWFIGVLRDRLAQREDRLFATWAPPFEPGSAVEGLRFRETRFSRPETKTPKPAPKSSRPTVETERTDEGAPIRRPFTRLREISANLGLRGGPGRIRTSNQTVMSGRL